MSDDVNAQLDALYAELPTVNCEGYCWTSCGPIRMSSGEERRLTDAGMPIPQGSFINNGPSLCPALTPFHQCGVYDIRPLICRMWGLGPGALRCNYGCEPSRRLTDREVYEFISRAEEISGNNAEAERARQALADPDFERNLRRAHRAVQDQSDLVLYRINGSVTR